MPHRESVSIPWRQSTERYRLIGRECACGNKEFPSRRLCPKCGAVMEKEAVFSGKGEIVSFTKIHTAPDGFEDQTPYTIAIVKLEEGPTITAQIVNKNGVMIGKKVKPVFRRLFSSGESGIIHYGFKFELAD